MKKIAVLVIGLMVAGLVSAQTQPFKGRTLSIITFASEFKDQGFVADFEKETGAKVDLQIVPNENYESKMAPLLKTGKGVPDVFTGEAGYVKEYVDAGVWEVLSKAPYNANTKDMFPYAVEMGTTKKGEVVALTWQTTPGGWFYRRSMAKTYFGTDDPAVIGKMFTSWETVIQAAETIKKKSGGKDYFFSGLGDGFSRIFTANRVLPWVNDKNEFAVDTAIVDYFKMAKLFRDNGYDAKLNDWSGPFFDSMNTAPADAHVFVFGWPTWGLHFVLNGQTKSNGDWAMAPSPKPFTWGGTWMGIYKNSPNKDVAWAFIKMLTQDKKYMEAYARRSGDFLSDKVVVQSLLPSFKGKEPALGPNDNHYEFFMNQVKYVSGKTISSEDRPIMQMVNTVLNEYLDGKKDLNQALDDLKARVKTAYPRWKVQ